MLQDIRETAKVKRTEEVFKDGDVNIWIEELKKRTEIFSDEGEYALIGWNVPFQKPPKIMLTNDNIISQSNSKCNMFLQKNQIFLQRKK